MKKRNIITIICILFSTLLLGQSFSIGTTIGVSKLYHNTDLRHTPLYNLYTFVALSNPHPGGSYTWEDFEEDYDIKNTIVQPRFGLFVKTTFDKIPLFLQADMTSSSSGYEYMSYSGIAGIADNFYLKNNNFISLDMGYKYTIDYGYGTATVVNSIGNNEARELAKTFFKSDNALRYNRGSLLFFKTGFGKDFQVITVGSEIYGEFDLTDKLKREARMSNVGIQIYLKFTING